MLGKPYFEFYFLKTRAAGDASWILDGVRVRIRKGAESLASNFFEVFALSGRELRKFCAVVPERWSQYEAHRVLEVRSAVRDSSFTDVYRNGSAALLLAGRFADFEYITLPLCAFRQAVQYGAVCRFAHDQAISACAGQRALLWVPRMLAGQCFCY